MTIYFFWGDDDFAINQEITKLKQECLDSNWLEFNFRKLSGDKEDSIRDGLMEAMTAPFGSGERLVILDNTTIAQQCSEELLLELQRTLTQIPATTQLLFTSKKKPNAKLKSSKLINEYAQVKEFSLIPPWQTDALINKVKEVAQQEGVKITKEGLEILANCVGNNSLLLWQEMNKLAIYQGDSQQPLDGKIIKSLVNVSNQNSLQLAEAILTQNINYALQLVKDLINLNEPALRIVATLVGQFRTWAIVKTAIEAGEKDEKKIAEIADIHNPKRIFFIKKQISQKTAKQLHLSLPILLELEANLKLGAEPLSILETKIIELCCL
jgi:DNA polymerase-3 subunit delta